MLSGLVSLNVHEPLTFEGTEICLHPDLFAVPPLASSITTSNNAAPQTTSVPNSRPGISSHLSSTYASPSDNEAFTATSTDGMGSTTSHRGQSAAPRASPESSILQVGDMIEIRVWDPLPNASNVTRTGSHTWGHSQSNHPHNNLGSSSHHHNLAMRQRPSLNTSYPPHLEASSAAVGNSNPPPPPLLAATSSTESPALGGAGSSELTMTRRSSHQTSPQAFDPGVSGETNNNSSVVVVLGKDFSVTSSSEEFPHNSLPTRRTFQTSGQHNHHLPDESLLATGPASSFTTTPQASPRPSPATSPGGPPVGVMTPPSAGMTDFNSTRTVYSTATNNTTALPPVFPRQPSSSYLGPQTLVPASGLSISQQQQTTRGGVGGAFGGSSSTTMTVSSLTMRPPMAPHSRNSLASGAVSPASSPHVSRPKHVREISDVTADPALLYGADSVTFLSANTTGTTTPGSSRIPVLDGSGHHHGGPGGGSMVNPYASNALHSLPVHHHQPASHHHSLDFPHSGTLSGEEEDDLWTQISTSHSLRLSFVMLVTEKSLTSINPSARTQVSLLRQVADLYQLSSYDMVTVHRLVGVEAEKALRAVSADFILVTIKDQYQSRGDLHFFEKNLMGCWIYEGQRLIEPSRSMQAVAREIRHDGMQARSGIITENTNITYRSRSARIFWLVQISAEMWDFASPFQAGQEKQCHCEIYFDKFISFVYDLFVKWKEAEVTHSLTVIFFSRTFIDKGTNAPTGRFGSLHEQRDIYGRPYEDHSRIVIENETRPDWQSLVVRIKEAFVRYPTEVGWNLVVGEGARRPSTAAQGNVLEAINVTLNLLQYHYLDRDLHRTGNSIVVVSAGNGVFEVDEKLAAITYQRMMDNGIGSDMLSLGLPPLHIAPFFFYVNETQVESEIPHWMHLSFVSYESDETGIWWDNDEGNAKLASNADNEIEFEVGPNGFLRLRSHESVTKSPTTFPVEPKAFSPHGNAAASPPTKNRIPSRERQQLMSDREIRDILEACRPRPAGMMPPALKTVLKMYVHAAAGPSVALEDGELADNSAEKDISEWDSMDHGDTSFSGTSRSKVSGIRDRADAAFPMLSRSPPRLDRFLSRSPTRIDVMDTRLDSASQSGSYSSQVSLLSVARDRPSFVYGSPRSGAMKMQKAPSLMIKVEDFDQDDAMGNQTEIVGKGRETPGSTNRFLELARKAMQKYDMDAATNMPSISNPDFDRIQSDPGILASVKTPKLVKGSTVGSTQSLITGPFLGPLTLQPGSGTVQSSGGGGIGAALSSFGSSQSRFQDGGTTSPAASRTSSSARLVRLEALGGRAISPKVGPSIVFRPGFELSSDGKRLETHSIGEMKKETRRSESSGPRADNSFNEARREVVDHVARKHPNFAPRGFSPLLLPPASAMAALNSVSTVERKRLEGRGTSDSSNTSLDPRGGATASVVRTRARLMNPDSAKVLSSSPGRGSHTLSKTRTNRFSGEPTASSTTRHGAARRRKALNPFRQRDEDEVLAQKSHNRRRWSHVFPQGEVEFKRQSGPNWKSLTAPAILPVFIDYFPPQREIEMNYTFSIFNVAYSEFERSNYSSTKYLFMEMVRQRITQDYQLVTSSHINANDYRKAGRSNEDHPDMLRMFLSMGHRLQVLHYDPTSDTVEVTRYTAKNSQVDSVQNTFDYYYYSYCCETQSYMKVVQRFNKYSSEHNWNKVDRIICGDDDREMREGMRFKRIMFCIIPDAHKDENAEKTYVDRFKRLLDYFEKLREKEKNAGALGVSIVMRNWSETREEIQPPQHMSTPGIEGKSMVKFYVPLRKGKRDHFENMEVSIDSTFKTTWSYRIIFNWLVASAGKVDAQIQLLQRRCTQFKLTLVNSSEISISRNVFLNPFRPPAIFSIKDRTVVPALEKHLVDLDYIHDGVFITAVSQVTQCISDGADFDFGKKWSKPPMGRQFIHRSGCLFVRVVEDRKGKAIVVVSSNRRHMLRSDGVGEAVFSKKFCALAECIQALNHRQV